MTKRQNLFSKYAFEIGVVTLPAYLVLLLLGAVWIKYSIGMALVILGIIGGIAALNSILTGSKDIKW